MTTATTTTPPTPQPQPATAPSANRRSRAEESEILRGKKTLLALPSLLAGIAAKDANAAKVRIDEAWVTEYGGIITAAQEAADGRAVARVDLRAATAQERASATQLAKLLIDVRDRVATHSPDDLNAQKAYGRGTSIDPRRTGPMIASAGGCLQAWSGQWKQVAVDAGVTQADIDQIQALRDGLSSADMGQHGVITSNADGSLQRGALFAVLRSMNTFAARVVENVFGKTSRQMLSLSDPRPLTNRGAAKKIAAKAAAKAKKAAKKAQRAARPRKTAAAVKRRAKRLAVAARAATLAVAKKASPKPRARTKAKTVKKPAKG